jgi:hypothetical protein
MRARLPARQTLNAHFDEESHSMANTSSAQKAARKAVRRTAINRSRG